MRNVSAELGIVSVGLSIARFISRVAGAEAVADLVDDGTGAAAALARRLASDRLPQIGHKIAEQLDHQLTVEFGLARPHDRDAAIADLNDFLSSELSNPQFLVDAVRDADLLMAHLLRHGGASRAENLGGEAGAIFTFLLERSVGRIRALAPGRPGFQSAAAAHLVRAVDSLEEAVRELTDRPIAGFEIADQTSAAAQRVRELAPEQLLDREAELTEMSEFATTGPSRWWIWQAPAQSGKTALMATFALQHHPGVAVVPFFVRRTTTTGRDRQAFLGDVLPRLAHLAGERYLSTIPTNAVQEVNTFQNWLGRAAAACQNRERPAQLLLLIDGIDEDDWYRDLGAHKGSILSLLPGELPPGTRVLLACRPNPPLPSDTDFNQSIRDRRSTSSWRDLAVSPHAKSAFDRYDVVQFMRTPAGRAVAAYLLTTATPLSVGNLIELVHDHTPHVSEAEVQAVIGTSHGRLLTPATIGTRGIGYTLGHDRIGQHVLTVLDPGLEELDIDPDNTTAWSNHADRILAPWVEAVCQWASRFLANGWPESTPAFLLSDALPRFLADHRQHHHLLVQILTDEARQSRIAERYGTLAPALRQVRLAQAHLTRTGSVLPLASPIDLAIAGRLAFADRSLARQLGRIPDHLPAAYARAGNHSMAGQLVDATSNPRHAQLRLAEIYLHAGDHERATAAIDRLLERDADNRIQNNPQASETTRRLVRVLMGTGRAHRARQFLTTQALPAAHAHQMVLEEYVRAHALAGLHEKARAAADLMPKHDRIDGFLRAAYDCLDVGDRAGALTYASASRSHVQPDLFMSSALDALARLYVACDEAETARSLADGQSEATKVRILASCADALLARGNREEAGTTAATAAESLYARRAPGFLNRDASSVASILIRSGRPEESRNLIASRQDALDATAHRKLASAYYAIGDSARGLHHLDLAYKNATDDRPAWQRMDDLAEIMAVAIDDAPTEFVDRLITDAARIAAIAPEDSFVIRAVSYCAEDLAKAGRVGDALNLVRQLDEGHDRAVLRGVCHAIANGDRPDQALPMLLDDDLLRGQASDGVTDLALTLAYAGHSSLALQAAEHARTSTVASDRLPIDLNSLSTSLARAGEINLALAALRDNAAHPATYRAVFREAGSRDWDRASRVLSEFPLNDPIRLSALIGMAEAAVLTDRRADAIPLLRQAVSAVPEPASGRNEQLVTEIVTCCAHARALYEARSAITDKLPKPRRFYAYARLAQELARLNDGVASRANARSAIEHVQFVEGTLGRISAFNLITKTMAEHAELATFASEAAGKAAEDLGNLGTSELAEHGEAAATMTRSTAAALARTGHRELARSLIDAHPDNTSSGFRDVVQAFAAYGDTQQALELLRPLSLQNRDQLSKDIVAAACRAGHFNEVRQLPHEISNPAERAEALLYVARSLATTSNQSEAVATVNAAVAAGLSSSHGSAVLADAAYILAYLGQFERSREAALESSRATDSRGSTLAFCAEACRLSGDHPMAAQLLAEAWLLDHDPYLGWATLVEIDPTVAIELARDQWGTPSSQGAMGTDVEDGS